MGIHPPRGPDRKVTHNKKGNRTCQRGAENAKGSRILPQARAHPEHSRVPCPRDEMIPAERIAVHQCGKDHVRCGKQGQRNPEAAAFCACSKEQESRADRRKRHGMGNEPEYESKDDKKISQHELHLRDESYSGRWSRFASSDSYRCLGSGTTIRPFSVS